MTPTPSKSITSLSHSPLRVSSFPSKLQPVNPCKSSKTDQPSSRMDIQALYVRLSIVHKGCAFLRVTYIFTLLRAVWIFCPWSTNCKKDFLLPGKKWVTFLVHGNSFPSFIKEVRNARGKVNPPWKFAPDKSLFTLNGLINLGAKGSMPSSIPSDLYPFPLFAHFYLVWKIPGAC